MIAAVSWVPKGISMTTPAVAEPPSKEEIEDIIKSGALTRREEDGNEDGDDDDDEVMEVDAAKQTDEVSHALAVADALGRAYKSTKSQTDFDDIADGLKELDMDHYDDEDEGIELFSTGLQDLYYPSNEMDPYLVDKDACLG
uniref:WD-repeat protein n=1 Tax=Rhizophora mucronata TaxID=61149 RepID=A0A2P2MFC8_RHIMU